MHTPVNSGHVFKHHTELANLNANPNSNINMLCIIFLQIILTVIIITYNYHLIKQLQFIINSCCDLNLSRLYDLDEI